MKYVSKQYSNILNNLLSDEDKRDKSERNRYKGYRVFKDRNELTSCIQNKRPISGIVDKDGGVVTAVGTGDARQYLRLNFNDSEGELYGECWFAPISVDQTEGLPEGNTLTREYTFCYHGLTAVHRMGTTP